MTNGHLVFLGGREQCSPVIHPLSPRLALAGALGWKHEARDQLMVKEEKTWKN